jgi:hypothetical protein
VSYEIEIEEVKRSRGIVRYVVAALALAATVWLLRLVV